MVCVSRLINDLSEWGACAIFAQLRMAGAEIKFSLATTDATKIAAQSYEASTTFAQGTAKFEIEAAGDLREFEVIVSPDGKQFAVTDTKGQVLLQPQPYPPTDKVTVQGTSFTLSEGQDR